MSSSSSSMVVPDPPPTATATATAATSKITTGSLTPLSKADDSVHEANMEGIMNGLLTLFPLTVTVSLLVRNNAKFAKHTNWQSRTALIVMPSMFVAALTSEQRLLHHMREMAQINQHTNETVHWAEQQMSEYRMRQYDIDKHQHQQQQVQQQLQQQLQQQQQLATATATPYNIVTETQHLASLYQQSIMNSGVNVVPGQSLSWYHHMANYTQQYPIRVLSALAIPSVAYIFYGQHTNTNITLPFSQKVLHTRVLGQFTTLCLLLGVMGFKEYMDQNGGQYISQAQVDQRIAEMHMVRQNFLHKVEQERQLQEEREKQKLLQLQLVEDQGNTNDNDNTTDDDSVDQIVTKKKKNRKNKKKKHDETMITNKVNEDSDVDTAATTTSVNIVE